MKVKTNTTQGNWSKLINKIKTKGRVQNDIDISIDEVVHALGNKMKYIETSLKPSTPLNVEQRK
jgi:hypothetical protein